MRRTILCFATAFMFQPDLIVLTMMILATGAQRTVKKLGGLRLLNVNEEENRIARTIQLIFDSMLD